MYTNILKKNLTDITTEEVETFCQESHIESDVLDYKIDRPKEGFARHFAAFSNQRGGVIILGVEEDKQTGLPKTFPGIPKSGMLIEQIHQDAGNVDPLPRYNVAYTKTSNGKYFIIISILEGDKTPYYVVYDSRLWIRTGSLKKPFDLAQPETVKNLIEKRKVAVQEQKMVVQIADDLFSYALRRAERSRINALQQEKQAAENFSGKLAKQGEQASPVDYETYQEKLGVKSSMCTVYLLPFFPRRVLMGKAKLKDKITEYRVKRGYNGSFPELSSETTTEGILSFNWRNNGYIECQQIFDRGLVWSSIDISTVDLQKKSKIVHISYLADQLYSVLVLTKNLYQMTNYSGVIIGRVIVEDVEDFIIEIIKLAGNIYFEGDRKNCLSPEYFWDLEIDTRQLFDSKGCKDFFISSLQEIYLSLGLDKPENKFLEQYIKQSGYSF